MIIYEPKVVSLEPQISRPRRCGWLDLVVLRYAVRINGITEICLTKLDVLDELKTIKVCTAYETPFGKCEEFPLDLETFSESKPVYDELPGWESDISGLTNFDDLPLNAKNYVKYISNILGVRISLVSVGSNRIKQFTYYSIKRLRYYFEQGPIH